MILTLTYVVKVMILHNQKILIVHTFTYYLLKSYLSLLKVITNKQYKCVFI